MDTGIYRKVTLTVPGRDTAHRFYIGLIFKLSLIFAFMYQIGVFKDRFYIAARNIKMMVYIAGKVLMYNGSSLFHRVMH